MDLGMIDGITGEEIASSQLTENSTTDSIYNYFTNRLETEAQNKENMALIDELKKRSAFANMATEQEMLQHITTLENQAAKVPALEQKVKGERYLSWWTIGCFSLGVLVNIGASFGDVLGGIIGWICMVTLYVLGIKCSKIRR